MDIFAILAGTLCTASFIPQILKLYSSKNELSLPFLAVYCLGVICWGLFGLTEANINWPLTFISFTQMTFVLILFYKAWSKK